jgi:hypothetical protein
MLKRTISFVFLSTLNNRRLFSLTTISNRYQQREINNQHRPFGRFHSNSKTRIQQNQYAEREKEEEDLDVRKPQFNRYNITRSSFNKKSIEDDDNDLFSEEKDDLTMIGTDKKAFSSPSITSASKPSTTAVSLSKKTET